MEKFGLKRLKLMRCARIFLLCVILIKMVVFDFSYNGFFDFHISKLYLIFDYVNIYLMLKTILANSENSVY